MESRFKQLRQAAGLTQEEFRLQFNHKYHRNYTPSAISRFENNKRIPETMALIDFADFFGVTVDYLIGRRTEESVVQGMPQTAPAQDLTSQEQKLLAAYRQSDRKHQELSIAVLEAGCMPIKVEIMPGRMDESGNLYLTEEEIQKYPRYDFQGKELCSIHSQIYEVEELSDGKYMLKPVPPFDPKPRKPLDPKPRKKQQEVKEDIDFAA